MCGVHSVRVGYVDSIRLDQIAGWAADPDAPDEVQELVILVDGNEKGRVNADRLRLDLRNLGTYGQGRHGFVFDFAPPLDPGSDYDVVVRFAGAAATPTHGAFRIRGHGAAPIVEFYEWLPPHPAPLTAAPRFVLHVGLTKTGTKYLQYNFSRLRRELRERGVLYPSQWWREQPLFAHHELAESLAQGRDQRLVDIFSRLNACGSGVVLLSSEGFNPIPDRGLEYLRELTRGAQIDVVFYARRWSDWIPSQWQQAVKQGSLQTFPEWHAALLSTADRHPGINQAIFLDKFARIFGRENIKLISYSNLMDHKVDLFKHFCNKILNLSEPPAPSGGGALVHESMGIFLTELIRGLNARESLGSERAGYHVFGAFQALQSQFLITDDVKRLFAAMERHVGELAIDDNASFLFNSYVRLNEYKDVLVSPEYGADVFVRQIGRCRYIRPDYLIEAGAGEAAARIAQAVRRQLEGSCVPSAA